MRVVTMGQYNVAKGALSFFSAIGYSVIGLGALIALYSVANGENMLLCSAQLWRYLKF